MSLLWRASNTGSICLVLARKPRLVFTGPALSVFPAPVDRVLLVIDDTDMGGIKLARMLGRTRIEVTSSKKKRKREGIPH